MRHVGLRNLWWLVVSVVLVALDQWTKMLVEANLHYGQRVPVLPFFNLTLAYNPGAAFSFLADAGGWQRWFFAAVALVVSIAVPFWLVRLRNEPLVACALALVLGGAVGNLWDRIVLGHVVDFLDFHWNGWHFPAFNVADSAITLGAVLLVTDMFFVSGRRHRD